MLITEEAFPPAQPKLYHMAPKEIPCSIGLRWSFIIQAFRPIAGGRIFLVHNLGYWSKIHPQSLDVGPGLGAKCISSNPNPCNLNSSLLIYYGGKAMKMWLVATFLPFTPAYITQPFAITRKLLPTKWSHIFRYCLIGDQFRGRIVSLQFRPILEFCWRNSQRTLLKNLPICSPNMAHYEVWQSSLNLI